MNAGTPGPARPAAGEQGNALIIGAVLLGVLLLVGFGLPGRLAPLHRSAIGFDGLVIWLKHNGLEARGFSGGGVLTDENVGLRILPLFRTGLAPRRKWKDSEPPPDPSPEDAPTLGVVRQKIDLLPTLLILPKWTGAVRETGLAHPLLLLPEDEVSGLLDEIDPSAGALSRRESGYVEFAVEFERTGFVVGLYHPQSVRAGDCTPILGDRDAMLLGKCDADGAAYYLLADPDLFDAHGLRLAENARIAVAMIRALADGRPTIVDRTTSVFAAKTRGRDIRSRTWSDLARFFAYPFSALWAGFAIFGLLVLWRAWVRYGPALRPFDDTPGASKEVSIAATARLLRNAGHDAKLLHAHVATRCQTLAAELLGPHRPAGADSRTLVIAMARRKSPELARAFEAILHELDSLDSATALSDLLDLLDRFEGLYQRTLHEFGRTSSAHRRDPR